MTDGASTPQPSSMERASGAIVGGVIGAFVGSFASVVPAVGELGGWATILGGVAGVVYGALRPPHFSRIPMRLPEAVAGEPVPVGALGAATVRDLEQPSAIALLIGAVLAIASIPIGVTVYVLLGTRPSVTVLGVVGVLAFILALVCIAFLPGLLLPGRPRAALVAHAWLGAREFRRAFGSPDVAQGFPVGPEEVPAWLASHPETEATREARAELSLMAGDVAAARDLIDRMPASTAHERFRQALLGAMLDYQRAAPVDDPGVRAALDAIPVGIESVEAAVAIAAFDARRELPDGDWREPLVRARQLIPEGDVRILARDFGAVNFRTILRKTWPILAFLVVLTIVLGLTVDGVLG